MRAFDISKFCAIIKNVFILLNNIPTTFYLITAKEM